VGEFELEQLKDDLIVAFERYMANSWQKDKGCAAKTAIAEALYRTGCTQESIYLQGIHYRQLEPVYGGREDTAAKLRVVCALGLVRMNYPQVMSELADLLADPEPEARTGAVRAVGYAGQEAGVPLLRFKVRTGDEKTEVLHECFNALLRLSPGSSLPFVAGFLDDEEITICEAAAIALGESRMAEAFDILKTSWEKRLDPDLRRTELLAMALLRHESAIEFLLSLVADGSATNARDAMAALGMYQGDEEVWRRVQVLVDARSDVFF
jgi:HEAT repeat protein